MDGVRIIFGFLDKLVYSLIKWILFGIFDLASLTTNSEVFSGIYSRIYVILGIFMAFKLSFSFIKYIIDPESISGKSDRSLSKLLVRTFVMLSALIVLPSILFGQNGSEGLLSRAQRAFLPTLPRLLFNVNSVGGLSPSNAGDTSESFTKSIEQSADDIAVTTLSGFFAPPDELASVCGDKIAEDATPIESLDEFSSNINLSCNRKNDIVIDIAIAHTGTKYYVYSYMWLISTVVGILIIALLLGITLDIAKRVFKMMILEVMAPIPIMSLIDPKGSKDGAFAKWTKSLISTFIDIFLKLGLVYLIIVFIHLIVGNNNGRDLIGGGGLFSNFPQNAGFRGIYLEILLILGLIFFAKEAPKFIKESLGFKSDGGGLFDDVKSVGKAAGLVGGFAAAQVGTIGAFQTNWRAAQKENKELHEGEGVRNFFRNAGSAVAGAIGGSAVASRALWSKNGGNPKAVMDALAKRNERRAANSTLPGRMGSTAYGLLTGRGLSERANKELKYREEAVKDIKAYNDIVEEEALDNNKIEGKYNGMNFNYRKLQGILEGAKSREEDTFSYTDANGNVYNNLSVDEFSNENVFKDIKKSQADEYSRILVANEVVGYDSNNNPLLAQDEWGKAYNKLKKAKKSYSLANMEDKYDGGYKEGKKLMGKANSLITEEQTQMRNIRRRANDRSTGNGK